MQFWKFWAFQNGYAVSDLHSTFIATPRLSDDAVRLYIMVQRRLLHSRYSNGKESVLAVKRANLCAKKSMRFKDSEPSDNSCALPLPRDIRRQYPLPFAGRGAGSSDAPNDELVATTTGNSILPPIVESSQTRRQLLKQIAWVRKTVPDDFVPPPSKPKRPIKDLGGGDNALSLAKRSRLGLHTPPATPHSNTLPFDDSPDAVPSTKQLGQSYPSPTTSPSISPGLRSPPSYQGRGATSLLPHLLPTGRRSRPHFQELSAPSNSKLNLSIYPPIWSEVRLAPVFSSIRMPDLLMTFDSPFRTECHYAKRFHISRIIKEAFIGQEDRKQRSDISWTRILVISTIARRTPRLSSRMGKCIFTLIIAKAFPNSPGCLPATLVAVDQDSPLIQRATSDGVW